MQSASDLDGTDFKPFFDMVVGILFVFLILIGALLFFQQSDQHAIERVKQQAEWQKQRAEFLNAVAEDLRKGGLSASVDLPNASIVLPLTSLAALRPDGLPAALADPLGRLGRVLEHELPCVAGRAGVADAACANRRLLRLNALPMQVRVSGVSSSVLPQDRFSQLLATVLQGNLMTTSPELLKLSTPAGDILVRVTGAAGGGPSGPVAPGIAGEAVLGFEFASP